MKTTPEDIAEIRRELAAYSYITIGGLKAATIRKRTLRRLLKDRESLSAQVDRLHEIALDVMRERDEARQKLAALLGDQ